MATLVPRAVLAMVLGVGGNPERWEYDVIAANIVSGHGHVYDRDGFWYAAYAPPLWSFVLAFLLLLSDSRASIQVVQALFCFGTALLTARVAREISGKPAVAMIAGLLVALQPSLLYYSVVKSDPLPLNVFLLSVVILQGVSLVRSPSSRRAFGFGILVGLGVLARGTPVVALPVLAAALVRRSGRAAFPPIVAAVLGCALCVAPWVGRNVAVLGAPILTSTASENFWRGNHAGAGGGVRDTDGGAISLLISSNKALPEPIRQAVAQGTERQRQDAFAAEAWRFIQDDPVEALRLYGVKLKIFWWRIESSIEDYPAAAALAYEWLYLAELALALVGMAAALALAIMVAVSLLQCAFYVQGRHRFLIEPVLLTFTALGVASLRERAKPSA